MTIYDALLLGSSLFISGSAQDITTVLPRGDLTSFKRRNETILPPSAYSTTTSSATSARCMDELRTGSICVDLGTPSSGHQRSMSTFRESAVSTPASLSIENAPMIAYTAISLLVPTTSRTSSTSTSAQHSGNAAAGYRGCWPDVTNHRRSHSGSCTSVSAIQSAYILQQSVNTTGV